MLSYMRLRWALVWLSVIGPATQIVQTAGGTQSEPIHRIGEDGTSAPIVLQKNDPKYPEDACRVARQGTVVLSLVVSRIGRAQDVKAVSVPLGLGLDEAAVQAIRTWRFKPGIKDGRAVPVYAKIEVNFHPPLECSAALLNRPSSK